MTDEKKKPAPPANWTVEWRYPDSPGEGGAKTCRDEAHARKYADQLAADGSVRDVVVVDPGGIKEKVKKSKRKE